MAGRPTLYNPHIAELICNRIASNHHGLRKLCEMFDDMPARDTIIEWTNKHPEFSDQYLKAKRKQIDLVIEELDEVLDENLLYYFDDKGNKRIDSPSATIAIAKANNKKWYASKLAPKYYGTNVGDEAQDPTDTITKIRDLVAGFNKTNTSDV